MKKSLPLTLYTLIMLGPSGFFLPIGPGTADNEIDSIEVLHSSDEGFSVLYRVCKNGRFFVYKALKEEYRGKTLYEELLTKDFNIGFSLNHPGICQYYAKIQHPQVGSCIVMEWIDGCTLEELIKGNRINRDLSKKILTEICQALDYMHKKQVIHRDLKPENILITHNGQNVKIVDLGLSDGDSYSILKAPAGTKAYASPELLAGDFTDNRSDLWSLGVIIGELHPFYRHISMKCLQRDREKRYPDANAVRSAILKEGSRKTLVMTVSLMLLLVIIAGGVFVYMLYRTDDSATMEKEDEKPQHIEEPTVQQEEMTKESDVMKVKARSKDNLDENSLNALFDEAASRIL